MEFKPTIFLIDDDSDDQEIFSIAIDNTKKSVNCVFADDGLKALEKINGDEKFIPDFIFIDMNMPRMNGLQCLSEIKKIDRLKHIPVYMYSTSADPGTVEENMKLGATEFIVKPSDINTLTAVLSRILHKQMLVVMFCLCWFFTLPVKCIAQSDSLPPVKELKKLSVEELMNIVVTSVSKSPEKLSEVASAIQVITSEDISRSTATSLPEALRLASNMQIAQSGSHDWAITARGFKGSPLASSSLANKLLVMIDGRTVYTPLFGGVYWDVQNVLLEDLDRIEVISGPGGTLWGANAVNGIINITSKNAKETQGLFASGAAGSFLKNYGALRFGSHVDTTVYYRVYAQHFNYGNTTLPGEIDALDSWYITQGGFRMDAMPDSKNSYTFQGDLYWGKEDDTGSTFINGQNLVARWTHTFSERSGLVVQTYFDRTYRNTESTKTTDILTTYDADIQHSLNLGNRNRFIWGIGFRIAQDNVSTNLDIITPENKTLQLYNVFAQDQLALIPERLELTLGSKLSYNDYTEIEIQPTVRLAWTPDVRNTLWTSVSRAVRTPSRLDADYSTPTLASPEYFKSEEVIAYELGYRTQPLEPFSFSLATYYNVYSNLRSIDTNLTPPPIFYFANNLEATTYGFEFSVNYILTYWWRMKAGYSYIHESFTYTSPLTYPKSDLIEAIDPKQQVLFHSIMNIGKQFQFDGVFRYIGARPTRINGAEVPAYSALDLRLAWTKKWITVSVLGQNLLEKYHPEFGTREIPRRFLGKISVVF